MIPSSVARRYVRALLSLGLEEGRPELYGEELERVLEAIRANRELRIILENPGYALPDRQAAMDVLASALEISPLSVNFLRLLLERQRIADLAQIARIYRAMVDQHAGRIRATVTSARPLGDDQMDRLRDAIGRMTGRSVVLESQTDSSLIGGLVAQVGTTLLDGSLRTQLERLRQELKNAPL